MAQKSVDKGKRTAKDEDPHRKKIDVAPNKFDVAPKPLGRFLLISRHKLLLGGSKVQRELVS